MKEQSIRMFLAVAETGSLSAAASKLHFSQPTASEYLGQLEHSLGVKIVLRERGGRKAVLTEAGKSFLPLAMRWAEQQDQLVRLIEDFARAQKQNTLRLAASSFGHQYIVSHIACRMMERCPDIELQLRGIERREIGAAIANNAFDAAFVFGEPIENEMVQTLPFYSEERLILCPADTTLPDRVICPAELLPGFEVYYSKYGGEKDDWHKQNFPGDVKPFFTVSNMAAAHQYLTDSRCWTIAPESLARMLTAGGRFVTRRIEPAMNRRKCFILINKNYTQQKLIRSLLECCGEYIKDRPYLMSELE